MTTQQILICLTIILYLAFITCVGVYFNRRGSGANTDEYYLGGRKMGPLVVAMSAEASDMSGWLLMGLPGLAYLTGVAEPFWTAATPPDWGPLLSPASSPGATRTTGTSSPASPPSSS